jgi:triacylglycerol lipase
MLDVVPNQDCILLLHGLGRTAMSMSWLARDFRAAGFFVVNRGYPSRSGAVESFMPRVRQQIAECQQARPSGRIHFVTHSMGGILLRQYFSDLDQNTQYNAANFGRAVMLGPPNQGSEIVDTWGKRWWFKFVLGDAGSSLGTNPYSKPMQLPSLPIEFAVIAGTTGKIGARWFGLLPSFNRPNDGKVAVASAKLAGMKDFVEVAIGHTTLPIHRTSRALAMQFVLHGTFQ